MNSDVSVGFVLHVMNVAGAEMLVLETIRRLGGRIRPVVLCLDAVGVIGERLRAEGVPVYAYDRRPGLDLSVARRMARDIRKHGVEVIHAHQYTPFFYSALAARMMSHRPRVIFTEHGRHYPDVVSSKRRLLNRLVMDRLADRVNAVCEFSAAALSAIDGFSPDRIEVVPNGIDLTRYEPQCSISERRLRLGLNPDRRYVVTVARLHPVKDHVTLIRGFAPVARTLPDVDLLLAGDGPLRGELEALVTAQGIAGRVTFLGVRDDVPALLQAADVFAMTSLSEAASLTLLEAMASALPVVVTAVGGNPEIVRDGLEGRLVPRGDVEAVAAALFQLLSDSQLASRLGAAARGRVHQHFSLSTTIERYYQMYTGAIDTRRVA